MCARSAEAASTGSKASRLWIASASKGISARNASGALPIPITPGRRRARSRLPILKVRNKMKKLFDGYKIMFFFLGIIFIANGIAMDYHRLLMAIGGALLIVSIGMIMPDIHIKRVRSK